MGNIHIKVFGKTWSLLIEFFLIKILFYWIFKRKKTYKVDKTMRNFRAKSFCDAFNIDMESCQNGQIPEKSWPLVKKLFVKYLPFEFVDDNYMYFCAWPID